MIDPKAWRRAIEVVSGQGRRANPQLQVLGDWGARRNHGSRRNRDLPASPDLNLAQEPSTTPSGVKKAVKMFHGVTHNNQVAAAEVDNVDHNVDLAYLADVTSVTFTPVGSRFKKQAKDHKVLVDGSYVNLGPTIRVKFSSGDRPYLCLCIDTGEAWIVGKAVEGLHEYCDDTGLLGATPCVEYAVDPKKMPKSSKNDGSDEQEIDYLHEFERPPSDDRRPVFILNEWGALVFSRDRTPVFGSGAEDAAYDVDDWFREIGYGGEDTHK